VRRAIVVRRAGDEDYEALGPLWREIDELHVRLQPGTFRRGGARAHPRAAYRALLGASDALLAVAEVDGALGGVIHAQLYDTPPLPLMVPKRRVHVDSLVVASGARRRGIGRRLMAAASDWGREHGAEEILLTVWAGNDEAERFYARLGFARLSSVLARPL
jgi:ribosomal protein S18 acetylase RimI-like enzyme